VIVCVACGVQRRLLGDVVGWVRGTLKCPYGPSQNASYVMTDDGNYYSATVADFAGRDAAVYRSIGPGRKLRTAQYNSRWLNGLLSKRSIPLANSPALLPDPRNLPTDNF